MFKNKIVLLCVLFLWARGAQAQEQPLENSFLTLSEVLQLTEAHNAELDAARAEVAAQEPGVTIAATPESPMLGYSQLNRNVETDYMVFSQRFQFPVKYFKKADVARQQWKASQESLGRTQWETLAQVKSVYYSLYSVQKMIDLAEANIKAVREFARTAERRYAAGTAPQYHSMRAHVELTDLQVELLELKSQEEKLQQRLQQITSGQVSQGLRFKQRELSVPQVPQGIESIEVSLQDSPDVQMQNQLLEMKEAQQSLAQWSYAPDFQVTYQKRIAGLPMDSSIFTVNVSVPLWFWSQNAQVEKARAEHYVQASRLRHTQDQVRSKVGSLLADVKSSHQILEIYRTSLIPQSQTAYTMSMAAYRSGRGTFVDVLDAEKAYYRTRKKFYSSLQTYVSQLAELERWLGQNLANWGTGGSK